MFGFGGDIHKAAQFGDVDKLGKLLKKGVDPNKVNKQGATPLFYTANTGSVECARLLIDYGADVNYKVPGGGTPLHSALLKKHEDLARWLVMKGADVNAATQAGVRPLHMAAGKGMGSMVAGLLREGAEINALTAKGQSALFLAAHGMYEEENDDSALQVLFEAGADPRMAPEWEERFFIYASRRNEIEEAFKFGFERLLKTSEEPEVCEYAQKTLWSLNGVEQKDESSGEYFIESPFLGRMNQMQFADWWAGPELEMPYWANKSMQVIYSFSPMDDLDFITEADAALQNFLRKTNAERMADTPRIDYNFQACSEIIYEEVTRDMLTDWQRELLDYEDRTKLWEHVTAPSSITIERRHRHDKDIYVNMYCGCEWEEEHGLQLVFRRGLMLTKLSQYDGHLTEADAFGIPDEEDELLSEFNRKYPA